MTRGLLRRLAAVLALAGLALSARAGYLLVKAAVAEQLIERAWAASLETGRAQRPWPWADTVPIGRLEIPELGYDQVVLEGASDAVLAFGPARLTSGAALAEPGNVLLAGHRTSWFRPLERLRRGALLRLRWRAGTAVAAREYRVVATHVVAPDDARLLAPSGGPLLTLVTCYPFGRGARSPLRFVVRAEPVVS